VNITVSGLCPIALDISSIQPSVSITREFVNSFCTKFVTQLNTAQYGHRLSVMYTRIFEIEVI
jgi:hypothetical protein